jgi:hypothetical protein
MGIAYVSNERKMTAFAAAALLLSSLSLGGCDFNCWLITDGRAG